MRFLIFTHSLVSDWNHGNAHFLRGVASELVRRRHVVRIFEPANGWSRRNLIEQHGSQPIEAVGRVYPLISSVLYDEQSLDLDGALRDADIVLVHEWNSHDLVRRIGEHRRRHRSISFTFMTPITGARRIRPPCRLTISRTTMACWRTGR